MSAGKVEFELPVHTFQIDFAGHVSNIVYIQWMEIARTRLLEAAGLPVGELMERGIVPVLAGTRIEYRKPLRLGERVMVEAWISELKGATACIEVTFRNSGGEPVAEGSNRGVFIERRSGRPLRMSGQFRAAFAPFLREKTGAGRRCGTPSRE